MKDELLIGYQDGVSGNWKDGILSAKLRGIPTNTDQSHWLVLDGTFHQAWTEQLNSLLDESK